MLNFLLQIELGSVLGPIIGGVISLLVAVWVSRKEANRQERQQRNNWYRQLHNVCVRIKGSRKINQRAVEDSKLKEYGRLYESFGEQINSLLSETPEEADLVLFNSMTNTRLSCIRYSLEVETPNPSRIFLADVHDTMVDFCLIILYVLEVEEDVDVDFVDELSDEELEMAEERYNMYKEGSLYVKEEELMDELREMAEASE